LGLRHRDMFLTLPDGQESCFWVDYLDVLLLHTGSQNSGLPVVFEVSLLSELEQRQLQHKKLM
jgi:hypothetical protein